MKKILSLFLLVSLIFTLCACAGTASTEAVKRSAAQAAETTNNASKDEASVADKPSRQENTTPFTNKFGTATTKCVVSGCNNKIASSGDSNCCTSHSNRCLNCNCYIDGDAMYCMSCITGAAEKAKTNSSTSSSTSSKSSSSSSSGGCQYKYSNGSKCGAKCSSGMTMCDKHFNELNAIYQSLIS